MLDILKKEIKTIFRGSAPYLLIGLLYLLVSVAIVGGYTNYRKTLKDKQESTRKFEQEWVSQKTNPHSAAHFGTYLFKPNSALQLIDKGLLDYMGNTYRVEAHYQHEMDFAVARDNSSEFRFGELTFAFILQLFVPLMIVFLGFSSISREKEGGTLKMIWAQGVRNKQLVWGKLWGIYLTSMLVCLPLFLILVIAPMTVAPSGGVPWFRITFMLVSYLLYYFLVTGLVVWVSVWAPSSKSSLQANLWGWVFLCILLPRLFVGLVDNANPLPARNTFNDRVHSDYTEGIDGNQDRRERSDNLKKRILAKYGKDSVQNLPINFEGLSMQYGEDYMSKVYDRHTREKRKSITDQNNMLGYLSFLNPVVAIRLLSMGLCGTDYLHQMNFHEKAKNYRDEFIRTLNLEMAYAEGSEYLKYDYEIDSDFFEDMEEFRYTLPPLQQIYRHYLLPICSMIVWGLALLILIKWGTRLNPDRV